MRASANTIVIDIMRLKIYNILYNRRHYTVKFKRKRGRVNKRKMLELKNFSKKYAGAQKYSSHDISLTVNDGEICGLVGSNGAGKSTMIKCITGILPFDEGSIIVNGFDVNSEPVKAKSTIGYVPDDHVVYDKLTGREYVNYMGSIYGVSKKRKAEVLEEYASRFHLRHALDNQIASYSHGMKQKICIIGSLVHDPALWILDEPMVGLDPQTMNEVIQIIKEHAAKGNSVVFSSHNLDVVKKVCDKTAFICGGQLVSLLDMKEVGDDFDLDGYFMSLNNR